MSIDRLPDAANLALGAMVLGQFLGDRPFSLGIAFMGVAAWGSLLAYAFVLGRERRE